MKAAVALASLAIAAALGYFLLRDNDSRAGAASATSGETVDPNAGRKAGGDGLPAARQRTDSAIVAASHGTRLSSELRDFRSGRNLRALYERLAALPSPTAEQQYVLADLIDKCGGYARNREYLLKNGQVLAPEQARSQFLATLSDRDPDRAKRVAAFEHVATGACLDFPEIKDANQRARALREAAAAAGEPKARAWALQMEIASANKGSSRFTSSVTDEQVAKMKDIVATGDPLAMGMVMRNMFNVGLENASLRLAGTGAAVDGNALASALELIACDDGADCGADAQDVARACAYQGQCQAGNLHDLMLGYRLPAASAQVLAPYVEGLRRAQAGDWSYFAIVRAPSASSVGMRSQ